MTNEELLKSISSMLKNNEDYLKENPEIFYGIQERLLKAIGYEDTENLEKAQDEKKSKVSRSGYRDWQPKDEKHYTPEQQKVIKDHMDQGFSHREAERFANAHDRIGDFEAMRNSKVNPSHPSDAFLEMFRPHALEFKQRAAKQAGEQADPSLNPQMYAGHRHDKAHGEAFADYDKDYTDFLGELDKQDLHPNEYDDAVSKWQSDWHAKNPKARDKMIQAADQGAEAHKEAKQKRDERIQEGQLNLIQAGQAGPGSTSSEFSEDAGSGHGDGDMDFQTAAQMIGGQKGEAGYEAGMVKDPNAIFREQHPEFVQQLKQKLANKLGQNPEAKQRHDAMPPRERTVVRRPAASQPSQPSPVKTFTPEEIKAQYGDKYKVKGDN